MKQPTTLTYFILIIICSSCVGYYKPNMVSVPHLSEKGDVEIMGGYSINDINLNAAVAIDTNMAIMANAGWMWNDEISSGKKGEVKRNIGEIGFGIFEPVSRHYTVSGYAGVGYGYIGNSANEHIPGESSQSGSAWGNFYKSYLQLAVSNENNLTGLDFFAKLNYMYTPDINIEGEIWNKGELSNIFTIETGINFSFGYKQFKFFIQNSHVINPNDYYVINGDYAQPHYSLTGTIGVIFMTSKFYN